MHNLMTRHYLNIQYDSGCPITKEIFSKTVIITAAVIAYVLKDPKLWGWSIIYIVPKFVFKFISILFKPFKMKFFFFQNND